MTLQQLRYVTEVADRRSISEAALRLFISQPSLSAAIRELEKEIGIQLFARTNRGVLITPEGAEFLGYARQVLQQTELIEAKYVKRAQAKQRFSVSTQHYAFTANAFVDLIKEFGGDEYEFTLRETTTYGIIDDVRYLRSEMGVLYLSEFNERVIRKLLKESDLEFRELFAVPPHIFISRLHPLAGQKSVALDELEEYPCLSIEQGEHNSFYFSEEILSTRAVRKSIKVTDRAAAINMLRGVDAYLIATGVFPSYLHGEDIIAVPLEADEVIRVGTVVRKDYLPTPLGAIYHGALERIAAQVGEGSRSER